MSIPGLEIDRVFRKPALARQRGPIYVANLPGETFRSARIMARAWAESLDGRIRKEKVWAFISKVITEYAAGIQLPTTILAPTEFSEQTLDFTASALALTIAKSAVSLDPIAASYWLSVTYTAMLPDSVRSRLGVYYTPPALSARLLDLATEAGTDWRTCRVLDPACGGGAFLGPAALRMAKDLSGQPPETILASIEKRLRGFEIDRFAAWLSQTFLEIALAEPIAATGRALSKLVSVCDALQQEPKGESYDLVVGNPPYRRVGLSAPMRERYKRSLYGHANLYGVFTDLALRWTAPGGVIAYVTPTSFLAGEYFKALRSLLAREAPPVAVDFIETRKGVFENVLQETMLATYRRGWPPRKSTVHHVAVSPDGEARVSLAGYFQLQADTPSAPWLMPRSAKHSSLIVSLGRMKSRLADWGYTVSTGPLVWNRHKDQLRSRAAKDTVPLVWAEAIAGPGQFVFRAKKKNHEPYFKMRSGDDWLRIDRPCVLLQRTTAKEQSRRLIAAALPPDLIAEYGGVVVENHLNMIRPLNGEPRVSPAAVAAVLNSEIVDLAFRCISGSVAVSAFELEALPLPSSSEMRSIESALVRGAKPEAIERRLRMLYLGEDRD
jgi:adenine-specific DNA-methyltransferase